MVKTLGRTYELSWLRVRCCFLRFLSGSLSFVVWFRTYGFVVASLFVAIVKAIVVQYLSLHLLAYADHLMNFTFGLFDVACLK